MHSERRNIVPPFLLSEWVYGRVWGIKKRKERTWYSYITAHAFTSHTDVWILMDSYQVFSPSLLPERQWVWSVIVNLASLLVAGSDINTLTLVSLPVYVLAEWWVSSGWLKMPYWMDCSTVPPVTLFPRDDASVMWVFFTCWKWEILFALVIVAHLILKVA